MLKFAYFKYELTPHTQFGAMAGSSLREGALLRITWPDGKTGYADLFPWTELGDADLDTQLTAISKSRLSYLVEQSIWMARQDALLRAEGKNAFQGVARVKNHFLINDLSRIEDATIEEARRNGFTTLKIKIGIDIEAEAKRLDRLMRQFPMLVRLDFNSKASVYSVEKFLSFLLAANLARIEFIEDPCPYHPEDWDKLNRMVPLAFDTELEKLDLKKLKGPLPAKVLVIKPARQDVKQMIDFANRMMLKMVITSSLDHPVGVAHATKIANETKKLFPNILLDCGCLSIRSYRANDFSTSMIVQGPYLMDIPGTGIGFDHLLGKIQWTPLN